ncbi:uncharacterized protein LOC133187282 [Saccostrea echinata]|uniref:uncharacterized protein LOC133187282 n=1 Tax=Saccostrea echinata TaxID=191078 RepID=UPI002A80E9E1|nr:uncharacterized protein LOC133187282 [Saccostrea echinata]
MIDVDISFIVLLILTTVIITIKTVEGGKCLQDAQRQCQTESAGLIEAQRQSTGVCSAYADYDSCIKTSISKLGCRLSPSEADLYEKDITNIYTEYPHGCTKTASGWIASYTARSAATGSVSATLLSFTITLGLICLLH